MPSARRMSRRFVEDRVLPRALCTGVCTRSYTQFRLSGGGPGIFYPLVTAGVGGSVVIDPSWAELQPTNGPLSSSAVATLITQLDDCQSLGLKVRLRCRVGEGAPTWVGDDPLVGRVDQWATNSNVGVGWTPAPGDASGNWFLYPGGMVCSWKPRYWELYRTFSNLLAAAIGYHPALAEVVQGLASTQFQEPCIMQFGWQGNLDGAIATGFSEAVWDQIFTESFNTHLEAWGPYRIAAYTAWNPIGAIVPGSTPSGWKFTFGNTARTARLMDEAMNILGGLVVLGNNSLTSPETNSEYLQMYDKHLAARQATPPTAIGFQTETLAKINAEPGASVQGTLDRAVAMGADNAEMPVGCQNYSASYPLSYITPALAASYNTSFKANAVGLWRA